MKYLKTCLVVLILLSSSAAGVVAGAENTTTVASTPTNNTSTTTSTATDTPSAPDSSSSNPYVDTGYGVVDRLTGNADTSEPATVIHTFESGVVVHDSEFYENPDYALVKVSVPSATGVYVADNGKANALKQGSTVIRSREVTLPKGTYWLKVRATADDAGDQSFSLAHGRETLVVSDDDLPAKSSGDLLPSGSNEYLTMGMGVLTTMLIAIVVGWRRRRDRQNTVEVGP